MDGAAAIGGGDAAGHAKFGAGVDGDGEGGAVRRGVFVGLRIKMQPFASLRRQRKAELARGLTDHKVDHLRRDELGGAYKIALVLAVFVVDEDDEATGLEFGESFGN
jgi:hypothetical protein